MANTVPWALSQTQIAVEFALSGVIEGARKHLDAVGICVVAGLAAFAGGTVRDIAAVAMDWRLPAKQAGATVRGDADDPPRR